MKNLNPAERRRHPGKEEMVAKMKDWLNGGRLNKVNILRITEDRFLTVREQYYEYEKGKN